MSETSKNASITLQCISKPVWKGMLKMLQLLTNGLEHSYANRGLGGMASSFQVRQDKK